MKNISAKLMLRALFVLVGFITLSGNALCSGNVSFKPLTEEGKVLVSLEDVQANIVSLSIEDKFANTVYYDSKVKGDESYKKVYDVSNLPDGTYTLTADFGKSTVTKDFTVIDSKVIENSDKEKKVCSPVFRKVDDKLIVLYQCPDKNDVNVAFKNDYETFFSHDSKNSKLAAKFDISELPKGDYEVVLNSGAEQYSYNLKVE